MSELANDIASYAKQVGVNTKVTIDEKYITHYYDPSRDRFRPSHGLTQGHSWMYRDDIMVSIFFSRITFNAF